MTRDDAASVRSDKSVLVNVLANDSDPDGLDLKSLAVVGGPAHGEAEVRGNAAGRVIRYEADEDDFVGTDSLRYRICDKKGACSVATLRVTVLPD